MEKKNTYREKIQAQIKEWESMIEVLQERAEKATAAAKIEIKAAAEKLDSEKNDLQKRLTEMMSSGGEAWENFKEGIEKAVTEMKTAIDKAMRKFK